MALSSVVSLLLSLELLAATRQVTFRTQDGAIIAASYYEPPDRGAPAVILLHMLTRSRDDWQPVAQRLVESGFAVLAIDLRGHGASSGAPAGSNSGDLSRMVLDVRAARAFLDTRPEIVRGRLGIGGASIGANLAILAAADDPAVRSIALLSPGLDYRGLRVESAMRKYGDRPALLVAGSNDPYATRSIRQLATVGTGIRELRLLEAAGHGTVMLSRSADLPGVLVDWFRRTLL